MHDLSWGGVLGGALEGSLGTGVPLSPSNPENVDDKIIPAFFSLISCFRVRLKLTSVMRGQLLLRGLLALATIEWISVSRERELEMVTPWSFPSEKEFDIQSYPPCFVKCTGFSPECLAGLSLWYTDLCFVLLSAQNEVSRVLRSIITEDHRTHPVHTPSFDPQLFVINIEVKNLFLT